MTSEVASPFVFLYAVILGTGLSLWHSLIPSHLKHLYKDFHCDAGMPSQKPSPPESCTLFLMLKTRNLI